jgi:antitoxin CptB
MRGVVWLRRWSTQAYGLDRGARERRALYRAQQRGLRELDLIIGKWAEENISRLSDEELGELEHLLAAEIPDMFQWLSGQSSPPEEFASSSILRELQSFTAQGNVLQNKRT